VLLVDAAFVHALIQHVEPLLTLATANDLADPRCKTDVPLSDIVVTNSDLGRGKGTKGVGAGRSPPGTGLSLIYWLDD
jgi:hypothetical protein